MSTPFGVRQGMVTVALIATAAYTKSFVGNNQANIINGTAQRDVIKDLLDPDTLVGHASCT